MKKTNIFLRRWKQIALLLVYIVFTTFLLFHNENLQKQLTSTKFFFSDPEIIKNLDKAIRSEPDTRTVFITRVYYNKPLAYWGAFLVNIVRPLDLPFLFSLTNLRSVYEESWGSPMLYPFELPLFGIAIVVFIRRWEQLRKKYAFVLPFFGICLLVSGLFIPPLHLLKLLPLVILLRLIIFIGISELVGWGI